MGPVPSLEVANSARNERTVFPCFLVRPTWLCHAVFAGHRANDPIGGTTLITWCAALTPRRVFESVLRTQLEWPSVWSLYAQTYMVRRQIRSSSLRMHTFLNNTLCAHGVHGENSNDNGALQTDARAHTCAPGSALQAVMSSAPSI